MNKIYAFNVDTNRAQKFNSVKSLSEKLAVDPSTVYGILRHDPHRMKQNGNPIRLKGKYIIFGE